MISLLFQLVVCTRVPCTSKARCGKMVATIHVNVLKLTLDSTHADRSKPLTQSLSNNIENINIIP